LKTDRSINPSVSKSVEIIYHRANKQIFTYRLKHVGKPIGIKENDYIRSGLLILQYCIGIGRYWQYYYDYW